MKKLMLVVMSLALVASLSACAMFDKEPPIISYAQEDYITMPLGSDIDVKAYFDVTDDYTEVPSVVLEGDIDTSKVGEQTVLITAKDDKDNTANSTLTFNIIDEIAPVLTLIGSDEIVIDYNDTYKEPGVEAVDNYDDDLEVNIIGEVDNGTIGSYEITYSTADNAGNETVIHRTVVVKDQTEPVMTLEGDEFISATLADLYVEAGVSAYDEIDGELEVVCYNQYGEVCDKIILNQAGEFVIKYEATDSSGNISEIHRQIIVEPLVESTNDSILFFINSISFDPSDMQMPGIFIMDMTVMNESSRDVRFPPFLSFNQASGREALKMMDSYYSYSPMVDYVYSGETLSGSFEMGYDGDIEDVKTIDLIRFQFSTENSYTTLPYKINVDFDNLVYE